jgi:outer membrane protein OmpA-like peptidoglycan-associated protein
MMRLMFGSAALAALAACSHPTDPTWSSFGTEAGLANNDGGFGNSTMNNTLVMTGQAEYRTNLNNRFNAEVPTTINFAFNSAALDAEAQSILRTQAAWIRQFPEVRFSVFGHTDLVGSAQYNYQLGLRRAQAAVAFLVSQGVERSRLDALVSEGLTQPVVMTQQPERQNRRTVTEVSGFVEAHPNVLNGKYAEIIFRDYVASAGAAQVIEGTTVADGSEGGG